MYNIWQIDEDSNDQEMVQSVSKSCPEPLFEIEYNLDKDIII